MPDHMHQFPNYSSRTDNNSLGPQDDLANTYTATVDKPNNVISCGRQSVMSFKTK